MRLRQGLKIAFLLVAASLLQGCLDAAVTGAQVAYNHSRIQKTLTDQNISNQAYNKLYINTHEFDNANISVATFHRTVLLSGQVPTLAQRQKAEKIVHGIPDIEKVYNLTEISTPSSTLTKMSDTWITGKIKAKLIAMNEIDPNQIKVVTENGTVFLMGMVLADQAEIAVDIARNTDGVQGVVKLFKYLRVSDK